MLSLETLNIFKRMISIFALSSGGKLCLHLSRLFSIHAQLLSRVRLCNPRTVAHQAPLSMGFYSKEYWSGLPCLLFAIYKHPEMRAGNKGPSVPLITRDTHGILHPNSCSQWTFKISSESSRTFPIQIQDSNVFA